jgi:demethylmenaquinone methyltransferase/2-methoxy-6-polyprenyl-1,4-benzoquinol methylase
MTMTKPKIPPNLPSDARRQTAPIIPPHPILRDYYADETERQARILQLFNASAQYYDRINQLMSFGTGYRYRRQALLRAGLTDSMSLLDVGCGTGVLAGYASHIVGPLGRVVALDPSSGMLYEALQSRVHCVVQGIGEYLPFADNSFDMLSMGYALRHVTDLHMTFSEYKRVLKPGGVVLLLEITPPQSRLLYLLLKLYLKFIVPAMTMLYTHNRDTQVLLSYNWDTIEWCVPPGTIMEVLRCVGFEQVHRHVMYGIFSEYTARKA